MFTPPQIADIYDIREIQRAVQQAQAQFHQAKIQADIPTMLFAYFERTFKEHKEIGKLITAGRMGEYEIQEHKYYERFFEELREVYDGKRDGRKD